MPTTVLSTTFDSAYLPFSGKLFEDTFTRSDASAASFGTPDVGPAWSDVETAGATSPACVIASGGGHLYATSNARTTAYVDLASATPVTSGYASANDKLRIKIKCVTLGAGGRGILFRGTGFQTGLLIDQVNSGGSNKWSIKSIDAGSTTTVATGTINQADGDVLEIVLAGTSVKLYVNGVLGCQATTSAYYAGTRVGITHTLPNNAATVWDDFSVRYDPLLSA